MLCRVEQADEQAESQGLLIWLGSDGNFNGIFEGEEEKANENHLRLFGVALRLLCGVGAWSRQK